MRIENILFPTDFSEAANRVLPHLVSMVKIFGSRISLLHISLPYADDPGRRRYLFYNEERYREYVESELQRIRTIFRSSNLVTTTVAKSVNPAAGILRHLERNAADLVAMGTHGRSLLGRFFLGTVAEKVVRHARCPVLTVAYGRENYRDNPLAQNILLPFDFSEHSVSAARYVRELACEYGAELHVLYVLTEKIQPSFKESSAINKNNLRNLAAGAREALALALGEQGLGASPFYVEIGSRGKGAAEEIAAFAQDKAIDLIVMARHGLGGVGHALMGSTTERVVRTAPCPVLAVH